MKIFTTLPEHAAEPTVLALGNFDGVHLGHQQLLRQGLAKARELNTHFSVLLFDPHPMKVLFPERKLELLTGKDERLLLFEKMGVDQVFLLPFTMEFANTTPEEFVEKILMKIGAVHLVVGFNYSFGSHGKGTPADLQKFGQDYHFGVSIVQAQKFENKVISSSEIRRYLLHGDIAMAKEMMGRAPTLTGIVGHGDGRGRNIGFPTANLETDADQLIPKNGVYAVTSVIDGKRYGGMMNIGVRPTFKSDADKTIEIYFFDFTGDLYNKKLTIYIEARLRSEKKFSGVEAIVDQLNKDKEHAKKTLQNI
ncbi:bifunctional riboflavin kinase/FAD synthetase [Dehalobacter sp. DCM]|uniref:bifunctional riboflavin kinase/FAD synthetase n=1 Tax=Dehalobacter sp. DCM TaxID=2907827 RepID=UPI003081BCB2|nr:bifunctional riboflavin kinase/FAD synthetase [Dehalobacter sp. DCM]